MRLYPLTVLPITLLTIAGCAGPDTGRALPDDLPRPLLALDFDSPLPADAVRDSAARIVEGRTGKGLIAAEGATWAIELPARRYVNLSRGTIQYWFKPLHDPASGKRPESNVVGLEKVSPKKILNTFYLGPGQSRLRGETFGKAEEINRDYHGTDFEYIELERKWYLFTFTWDSTTGEAWQYLNGVPHASSQKAPWTPDRPESELHIGSPDVVLDDVYIFDRALSRNQISQLAGIRPGEGLGERDSIQDLNEAVDWPPRGWQLAYENGFDAPSAIDGWRYEGGGHPVVRDGRLFISTMVPNPFHSVFWMPPDFPGDFCLEWDVELISPSGLYIVFFAAKGLKGEDLFDPALEPREGKFPRYTHGQIRAYHLSYCRVETGICNLRKDPGMDLIGVSTDPLPREHPSGPHRLQILKQGARIQFSVNGKLTLSAEDTGRDGQPVWGEGKIGFRAMTPGEAWYDNVKVWVPSED